MLYQSEVILTIVWIVIATIVLGLFIYLSTRWIVSKTKASDKLFMIFIAALLGVLVVPLIGAAWNAVMGPVGGFLAQIMPPQTNYLLLLAPILQFLFFMIIIKFLLDEDWGDSVWISLLSLFLLYLLYTIFPVLYNPFGINIL